jgi:hypothetical protein
MQDASLLPISAFTRVFDALLGEKDGMRGAGLTEQSAAPEPPHPIPLPAEEREELAARALPNVLSR